MALDGRSFFLYKMVSRLCRNIVWRSVYDCLGVPKTFFAVLQWTVGKTLGQNIQTNKSVQCTLSDPTKRGRAGGKSTPKRKARKRRRHLLYRLGHAGGPQCLHTVTGNPRNYEDSGLAVLTALTVLTELTVEGAQLGKTFHHEKYIYVTWKRK